MINYNDKNIAEYIFNIKFQIHVALMEISINQYPLLYRFLEDLYGYLYVLDRRLLDGEYTESPEIDFKSVYKARPSQYS